MTWAILAGCLVIGYGLYEIAVSIEKLAFVLAQIIQIEEKPRLVVDNTKRK
jgi:hypothetical protein